MAVVEDVEVFVVADKLPQRQNGLSQRETRQHFPVKVLLHGPFLGKGRECSPTSYNGNGLRFGKTRKAVGHDLPIGAGREKTPAVAAEGNQVNRLAGVFSCLPV